MASNATLLTRRQTAALLGVPEAEVKARDNEAFHPVKGPDGGWRYQPEEVAVVLRGAFGDRPGAEPTGSVCADAFELFQAGKKLTEVVIALKQPPALVRSLRAEFDAMALSLTIAPTSVETMAKVLGTTIRDEAHLVALVEAFSDRLRLEYRNGYGAGMTDANDLGEIVDPGTGKKRPLKQDDIAAGMITVEERWGKPSAT
jgi:hypothetical protein